MARQHGHGSCTAVLAVLLLMALHAAASDASSSHMRKHNSQIPSCRALLERLSDSQFSYLRDSAQAFAQHQRKASNLQLLLQYKRNPPSELSKQYAYNSTKTEGELQQLLDAEERAKGLMEEKMTKMVGELQQQGAISSRTSAFTVRSCVYGRLNTHMYEYRPKVSLLMQYFKRSWNIQPYIERVKKCSAEIPLELVVNVDHPQDHEAWGWASYNSSGLVVPVFSNNVHEVRAYNRLAHIAQGEYLVLVGDDDLPPSDCTWIKNLVQIFDKWHSVGIIGIRNYVCCWSLQFNEFDGSNRGSWFKDPALGLTLQFVEKVDMAPLAVRKSAYLSIGGMDEAITEPGECGMWVAGWQVAATDQVAMEHDKEPGGTHRPETQERCWGKQQHIASNVMQTHMSRELETEICNQARELTLSQLQMVDPTKCPYREGCQLGVAERH